MSSPKCIATVCNVQSSLVNVRTNFCPDVFVWTLFLFMFFVQSMKSDIIQALLVWSRQVSKPKYNTGKSQNKFYLVLTCVQTLFSPNFMLCTCSVVIQTVIPPKPSQNYYNILTEVSWFHGSICVYASHFRITTQNVNTVKLCM